MASPPAAEWGPLLDRLQSDAQTAFSQAITFRPLVGVQEEGRGIFEAQHEVVELRGEAEVSALRPVLEIKASDFAQPVVQGDQWDIASVAYEVTDVQETGKGSTVLMLMVV